MEQLEQQRRPEHKTARADQRSDASVTARDKPNKYVPRPVASFIAWVERLNIRHSRYGNPAIYSPQDFPWVKEIEVEWPVIRKELENVMKMRDKLPNFHDITKEVRPITTDDKWKTFFLAGYGVKIERNARLCPATVRLLSKIPGMKTAFFSILSPHKHIPVHKGAYNGVLRYHLGLKVPTDKEACRLWIDGQTLHWDEGTSMIFDDTFDHKVDNETNEFRAILFVDFVRPIKFPFSLVNKAVLKVAPFFPNMREAKENHENWEKEFYKTQDQR